MILLDETIFGNPVLRSDSGLTVIVKKDGIVGAEGFSKMLYPNRDAEDLDMRARPKEIWEEFFKQTILDEL